VERYVIRGGEQGYQRLQLLAGERWPDTAALFARAGLAPGMRCIDLGCGGGAVTLGMASLVAPGGSVVGVDMDAVKLGLARQAAGARGLGNVEFRQLNLNDWHEPAGYDAVYCRFVLQHLSQPGSLLRRMWEGVRPGGVLIVEDADFDGWCCHPPSEAFGFFVHSYREVIRRRGGDHAAGRKLYAYSLAAGVPGPQLAVVQPVHLSGQAKTLAWSTLEATAEPILAEGLATQQELTDQLASLAAFTADERTLISGPRVFQLWSRRPAGPGPGGGQPAGGS
jgi:ubiquinone/menaquinone biosynthesis C-methylase UbiE